MIVFKFPTISVKAIDESVRFYTEILGLQVSQRLSPREGINIVFVIDDKGNKIELIQNDLEKCSFSNDISLAVSLNLKVNDLAEFIKFIHKKGIKVKREPRRTPTTEFIVIEDPNGVEIALHGPLKPDVQ